jgi:hypothetical protein
MLKKGLFSRAFSIVFALALMLAQVTPASAAPSVPAKAAQTNKSATLLQYSAGGHILGFDIGKVYLAVLDHALTVEFVGGDKIRPVGVEASSASRASEPLPRAVPIHWLKRHGYLGFVRSLYIKLA